MNAQTTEVVRQEYVHTNETPMLSLKAGRVYVNRYAINLYPNNSYIQIMIDRESKEVVILPVKQGTKDSFRWCGGKKKNPRKLKCLPVFYEIYKQMGWDTNCRYRIQGREETDDGGEKALYFSLKDAVCFRMRNGREAEEFPKEWQGTFGERKTEHKDWDYIARYGEDQAFSIELPIHEGNLARMQEIIAAKEAKQTTDGDRTTEQEAAKQEQTEHGMTTQGTTVQEPASSVNTEVNTPNE